jgi:hypothetical protein
LFAFEWEDPHTGRKTQMTWTRIPQGFKNSPTLFGEALAADLSTFPEENPSCTLLQYVDDLLLASHDRERCWEGTKALLARLSEAGYKVSWKKAQICQREVRYLGFIISEGQRALGPERKRVVCSIPQPKTKKEVREFLGVAGFCRIWILGYSDMAKPLYEATAGSGKDPLNWGFKQEKAFQEIKRLLTSAPALGLPDVKRSFNLFVCEKNHTALGVLTQTVGPWQRPVAYLSKRLDPVASGWPPCLRALAATVTLIKEADKLTLGQDINVKVPHAVIALMNGQGHKWLTSSRMAHYQGLLCENPRVRLETVRTLNPATFLPTEEGLPDHDCEEVMDEVYSSRPDLMDLPLSDPELELFTDRSSFIQNGR